MSLFYITGPPGTGKTTIQKELRKRGYEAYDIDESRFGGPVNKATGESTTVPPIEQRTAEWFNEHEWRVSREAIQKLKNNSEGKNVYLCGTASTDGLVWDLFDKVLYLNVDETTLRERLASREDNDFGKTEHEQQIILERYRESQKNIENRNMVVVDAAKSVDDTVSALIAESRVET